jgi:MFS family permease
MSVASEAVPSYPSHRVAWYTVFVLMVCYTLSYADRQILAFLVGPMKHDLAISDTDVGLLQGVLFAAVYTGFGVPFGVMADRLSRRNIIAFGVVVWSLATSLASVTRTFGSLAVARMGVGIGEATLSPCAFSMIADSFPKERLSSALSVYTMGIQLGSGLALIIGGLVAQAVSHMAPVSLPLAGTIAPWRLTFLIVGVPGLAIAFLLFTVREPARQALLTDSAGVAAPLGLAAAFKQIRRRGRSTVGLALIISCQATCNYALLFWSPTFFERMHHWPKDRAGLVLGVTTLACGCLGLLVGGRLSDRWHERGLVDAPLRVGLLSLVGLAVTLVPATLVHTAIGTVVLLVPAVFCIGLPIGCGYAGLQMIFPNQARGFVSSLVILAVALIGLAFGSTLPGLLNDHLFHDESKIGYSMSITVALACVLGIAAVVATLAPYRADYRAVHSG